MGTLVNKYSPRYNAISIALLLGVLWYPFQDVALRIYTSRYDISVFLLLFVSAASLVKSGSMEKRSFYFLAIFIGIQALVFSVLNFAPLHRFISGLFFFGGLLTIFISRHKVHYRSIDIYKAVVLVTFVSAVLCVYDFLVIGGRPKGWFGEPSYAGLALYGASLGLLGVAVILDIDRSRKIRYFIASIFFFITALMTLSTHIISYLVVFIFVIILRSSVRRILPILLLGSIFLYSLVLVMNTPHFKSRLDFSGYSDNLSTLSWLRGLDQAQAAIIASPVFGCGLGSTGFIDFNSINLYSLHRLGLADLNLYDAYSLLFRVVVELGLPFLFIIIIYLYKELVEFRRYIYSALFISDQFDIAVVFNFIFSSVLIVGSLLKEGNYSTSILFISVFLFFTSRSNRRYLAV
ncbi:hypothetical protein EKD00_09000 [Chlorobium phaeovibrioides]|uniref:hypothetical protein n=1 Tax=Chlorobium phaeovibrioides TaxID=1094 RepID=UPI000F82E3C2|nr:hypothetical protein [Chlorobium phaeovibrioides]RTY33711.1 hypothetical protein EKD00_09000 [Chlorobium phaeovibrioides]